jgi:ribosomal protein L20
MPAALSAIMSHHPQKARVFAMSDQNDDKREMRIMWIASAAIAVLILGAMGINMLVHHETSAAPAETTQSPAAPPK